MITAPREEELVELVEVAEEEITRVIMETAIKDWLDVAEADVVIAGAGPSGLTTAIYTARAGLRTVIFEKKLSFGGGMGGGGMLFHKAVVEAPAHEVLADAGCRLEEIRPGLYVVDTAEMIAKLASAAVDAGAKIILGVSIVDLVFRGEPPRVEGAVLQWSAVKLAGLHVDPMGVRCRALVDCTGHDAEVLALAASRMPGLGLELKGHKSMWAPEAERLVVKHTGRVCPGLYVAGMAVATLYGLPRMGPIFGGMLLSGKKVARAVIEDLTGLGGP